MPNSSPERITLVEAALRARESYAVVHRLMLTGRLDGVREGGRWLVTLASVDAYLAARPDRTPVAA